jgi:hypothetical protein
MGGVRYTTGLFDENFYSNPARTSANPRRRIDVFNVFAEINSSFLDNRDAFTSSGDTLQKISSTQGSNNHVRLQTAFPAIYLPRFSDKNSLAIGILTSSQADIGLRRSYRLNSQAIIDLGPAATFSREFIKDHLAVGVTSKLSYRLAIPESYGLVDFIQGRSLSPSKSGGEGAHIDFDLGATWILPYQPKDYKFTTALAINNLLGGNHSNIRMRFIKTGLRPPQQPRSFSGGISAEKKSLWIFTNALLAVEMTDVGNNSNGSWFRTLHIGHELRYGVLAPRLGINQGYFGGGLGILLPVFELELATYGEEMSLNPGGFEDRRYALKLGFSI